MEPKTLEKTLTIYAFTNIMTEKKVLLNFRIVKMFNKFVWCLHRIVYDEFHLNEMENGRYLGSKRFMINNKVFHSRPSDVNMCWKHTMQTQLNFWTAWKTETEHQTVLNVKKISCCPGSISRARSLSLFFS